MNKEQLKMDNIGFYFSSRKGINTGRGGAYYSLLAHKEKLNETYETVLIHDNELEHDTILDNFADENISGIVNTRYKIGLFIRYFSKTKPKVFFCYSARNFTIVLRILCKLFSCKFIYVRPAGPNLGLRQFYVNVLFFNSESLKFCKGIRCLNSFVASNRISSPVYNEQRLKDLKLFQIEKDILKICRISRLNKIYLPVFLATIELHKTLIEQGIKVVTHLIGFEEESDVVNVLKSNIADIEGIFLFTKDEYTINASELLPAYDIVVGIGRGFWEAVAYDKFVIGFANNFDQPVLVEEENLHVFKDNNFSTRVNLKTAKAFTEHFGCYVDLHKRKKYLATLKEEFHQNYSTALLGEKLIKIIDNSQHEKWNKIFRTFVNFLELKIRRSV